MIPSTICSLAACRSFFSSGFGLAGGGFARPGNRTLTGILVAALLYSFGRYSPLFPLIFDYVPAVDFFRRPIDGVFIVGIAIALLSGQLISDYVRQGLPRIHPLLAALALAAGLVVLVSAVSVSAMTGHAHRAIIEILKALAVVAVLGFVLSRASHQRQRAIAATLIAGTTAVELIAWNAASRMNAEASSYYRVLEQASGEDAVALGLLREELNRRQAEGVRPRIEVVGLGGPWQNLSVVLGMESTNGYNPLRVGIYDKYISPGEASYAIDQRQFPPSFSGYDSALARAAGLEYVVLDRPIEQFRQLKHPEHIRTLKAGPRVWIYRLAEAEPRVRFTSRVEVADVDATLANGDLRNPPDAVRVIVDDEKPLSRAPSSTKEASTSSSHISAWGPGYISVAVEAKSAGVLILHDVYYPGWIAEVDGVRTPIYRADVVFRAVEVPAGKHRVEFQFRPLGLDNLITAIRQLSRPQLRMPAPTPPTPITDMVASTHRDRLFAPKAPPSLP